LYNQLAPPRQPVYLPGRSNDFEIEEFFASFFKKEAPASLEDVNAR
jgi:hypothetical protein